MRRDDSKDPVVGCSACWQVADRKVTQGELTFVAPIFSEDRFSVMLRRCAVCTQSFARVYCTMSQLARDSDDSGSLSIPVSAPEISMLHEAAARGDSAIHAALHALPERAYSIETGGPAWLTDGPIRLLPHD